MNTDCRCFHRLAAPLAAFAEHVFPILLLLGLATRFSALALLGMTLAIQVFVYPDVYPTHGVWAAVPLYLLAKGPGRLSIDHWIAGRYAERNRGIDNPCPLASSCSCSRSPF